MPQFTERPAPGVQTVKLCGADGCDKPAVLQWIRAATETEAATAGLPAGSTANIAVFGCADHALDVEAAARTHDAACSWPDPCSCLETAVSP